MSNRLNRRVFLSLLTVLVPALWIGCATKPEPPRIDTFNRTTPFRIACVGDSITFGSGIENPEVNSYPHVLGLLLGDKFDVRNFGVSGATLLKNGDLPWRKTPAFSESTNFDPDLVLILLGTNDTKPQNWKTHGKEFADDLAALVEHFQKLPSHPQVWLVQPVPVYEDRWGINEKDLMEGVLPAIQRVADQKKLPVIDLNAALSDRPELFSDKIHPNAAGAKLMAQTIRKALLGM
jgi:acyl-CoA thioesterase-1